MLPKSSCCRIYVSNNAFCLDVRYWPLKFDLLVVGFDGLYFSKSKNDMLRNLRDPRIGGTGFIVQLDRSINGHNSSNLPEIGPGQDSGVFWQVKGIQKLNSSL